MHSALRTVAKVPPDELGEGVKIWAEKVKELSYQMEDIVDTFMVHVQDGGEPANPRNRVKKLLKKTIKLFRKGKNLHRISDALEEAIGQAKELAELRQRYELVHATGAGASIDPRVMTLYKDVTDLVGIEDTRDELINMLIEGDDWLNHPQKTVSIVGFGGLGKTTLAKAAYDMIKGQFDCGAFVTVSQNPDMKKILKDILFELDNDKYTKIYDEVRDETHLIDEIIRFLNDKRYLIVIDDIWDKKVWKVIKCAFLKKSTGSRVITTTRIGSVSEACCSSIDDIYRMKALSNDVAKRLFYKRVFSNEKKCPHELVQVSKDILKKCGGIPLAIITIASLLASNCQIKTKNQWYDLLNSIGRGLTEDPDVEEMKKIILFSYYDLPSHLKPCLLYLSIFPEDHKIMRDELIWRWIAEGFICSEKQETSLYELGDCYFNELINRNMVQPVDIDEDGRAEACHVHDMVLDVICSLSSEENFVTILDGTKRKLPNPQRKVCRLSIHKSNTDVPATTSIAQARSVTVFGNDIAQQMPLISSSKGLRVLALEGCAISDIGHMDNLLHLRYLGLRGTWVEEFLFDIGKLHFLQTLDLRGTKNIRELPSSIVWLRNLMCLYIDEAMNLPCGIANLTSLEVLKELRLIDDNLVIVKEMCHLIKLKVLEIGWYCSRLDESMGKTLAKSLSNLHRLESLRINAHGRIHFLQEGWIPPPQLRKLVSYIYGSVAFDTLPSFISPTLLPLLSYLVITVYELQPEDIQLLGMLPTLRYLYFRGVITKSISMEDVTIISGPNFSSSCFSSAAKLFLTSDAFPCATKLSFDGIPVMPSAFPRGAAPRLKHLEFSFRAKWITHDDVDLGMGHLPSLQTVRVQLHTFKSSILEVRKTQAALTAAARDHPNRPDLSIRNGTTQLHLLPIPVL